MKSLVLKAIYIYQKGISPLLGPRCRFYPSCSEYATQAFQKRSFFEGLFLSLKRILKCHPFHPGGFDFLESRT